MQHKKSIHVVYVTPEFVIEKPSGGLATYIANVASIMAENGNKVTVLVVNAYKRMKNRRIYWVDNSIEIIYLSVYSRELSTYLPKEQIYVAAFLAQIGLRLIHKKNHIDIVHYANLGALALLDCRRYPALLRLSSYPGYNEVSDRETFEGNRFIECCNYTDELELKADLKLQHIMAPSHFVAAIFDRELHREVKVIESPAYIYTDAVDESLYLQKLEGKKYFLFVGRLSREKGIHTICEILQELFSKYPDIYFVFAGVSQKIVVNGKRTDIVNYIRKSSGRYYQRVIYLGTLEKKFLFSVEKHALAVILPSRVDNLSNVCIEAMNQGKIVIGTKGASFEQLIEDGSNGYLIARDDSKGLIKKMEKIIKAPVESIHKLEEAARKEMDRFAPQIIYERLIQYYLEIIEKFVEGK